jgi:hypothetical protein
MAEITPLLNGVQDDCEIDSSGNDTAEEDYQRQPA